MEQERCRSLSTSSTATHRKTLMLDLLVHHHYLILLAPARHRGAHYSPLGIPISGEASKHLGGRTTHDNGAQVSLSVGSHCGDRRPVRFIRGAETAYGNSFFFLTARTFPLRLCTCLNRGPTMFSALAAAMGLENGGQSGSRLGPSGFLAGRSMLLDITFASIALQPHRASAAPRAALRPASRPPALHRRYPYHQGGSRNSNSARNTDLVIGRLICRSEQRPRKSHPLLKEAP